MVGEDTYLIEARHGALGNHRLFRTGSPDLERGDRCVVRTDRGVELGVITGESRASTNGDEEVAGEVLRRMNADDDERQAALQGRAMGEDYDFCIERIRERELPMRLVLVEHLFGGGRIIFYFVADGRVDFRELVKDLARQFRTRIELRQIGVRDEAKILGDREYCDRELCCLSWMREILPVTMRMAKNQKSTLDPNKISGRCGRLKCCLRFEDDVYCELRRRMPRPGDEVRTEMGSGSVLSTDIISRSVSVQLATGEKVTVPVGGLQTATPEDPTPPVEDGTGSQSADSG